MAAGSARTWPRCIPPAAMRPFTGNAREKALQLGCGLSGASTVTLPRLGEVVFLFQRMQAAVMLLN
ncbi:MAG: hypothetical protein U5J95_03575 [Balneolaceae bacterium]|nr:hypothetical protein [Balneolaceae bacterium]